MDAKVFIECNSAHPCFAMKFGYNVISTANALEALKIQKKADEDFFRNFLLSVIVRHSSGEQFDLETEFNEKFQKI